MAKENEIELRSEEVQEILTRIPNWIIRFGSFVILMLLLVVFFVSWLVKYPDVITSPIIITTNIPPEKLIAKTSGKIETILIQDKQNVNQNTPLAVIENAANFKDVFLLKSIVDTIDIEKQLFPFELFNNVRFGEIEQSFALFQKEYIANSLNEKLQPFKVETTAQSFEQKQLQERLHLLLSQKSINESELQIQKSDLNRYEGLYKKGVIATQEMEKQRLIYLQSQKNYQNLLSSISQLKSSINELNRSSKTTKINESKEFVVLERNVMQSFYQLKKAITDWDLQYVFRSSINGKVSFMQIWSVNQVINSGDNMFAIIPSNENGYIGKVKAVAQNSGKIKIGQDVNIRLANYPDRQFGVLKGKVKSISLTPDKERNLLIDISLPKGLTTSYKKEIQFQQEMSGNADIITEDLRLIERLLYQFKSVISR
jgi:multidrug efflux pump subunit AcrA (membrane-fusion protein)